MWIRKLLLFLIIIYSPFGGNAQEAWPSPELEQMYRNVQEYKRMGNTTSAIVALKQLVALVPAKTRLKTELGGLYYLAANYEAGEATLLPVTQDAAVTDTTYQLLAACQLGLGHNKQAKKTINKGLWLYPNSGMLYYRQGLLYSQEHNKIKAQGAWDMGIIKCPAEPLNYLESANARLNESGPKLWGLIYGETYLAMRADTTGNAALKQSIYAGYKEFFTTVADEGNKLINSVATASICHIYEQLTPVVSDGVTTESLTMARTRFLMEWVKGKERPMALFTYQDELVRSGWFDIYNEWIFGNAENNAEFKAWNKFHTGDMERFEQWRTTHLLQPAQVR